MRLLRADDNLKNQALARMVQLPEFDDRLLTLQKFLQGFSGCTPGNKALRCGECMLERRSKHSPESREPTM